MRVVTQRLTVIGIGNLRYGLPIIGALANYFGERPIELALYDADQERLELFARFARAAFSFNGATHSLLVTQDSAEALEGSSRVILALDENCARRHLKIERNDSEGLKGCIEKAAKDLLQRAEWDDLLVLCEGPIRLRLGMYRRVAAPPELDADAVASLPHQMLRWIKGDDMLYQFLKDHERSPVFQWLDHPESAEIVADA